MRYLVLCAVALIVSSCYHNPYPYGSPEQFVPGDVTSTPVGCVEGRIDGVDC